MEISLFKGSPAEIGRQYGKVFAEKIRCNLSILVWREGYEPLPLKDQDFKKWVDDQEKTIAREWPWLIEEMHDKAILVFYNHSDWEGKMRLKPDWEKLGLGDPKDLKAENAVHSTGIRLEKTGDKDKDGKEVEKAIFFPQPEEYAKIENGELVFPMTKWNYRMIVLERK